MSNQEILKCISPPLWYLKEKFPYLMRGVCEVKSQEDFNILARVFSIIYEDGTIRAFGYGTREELRDRLSELNNNMSPREAWESHH